MTIEKVEPKLKLEMAPTERHMKYVEQHEICRTRIGLKHVTEMSLLTS